MKHAPATHFAWALLAAGAWWLGTYHAESGTATERESRIRVNAADAAPSGGALRPDGSTQPVVASPEALSWVRSWCGSDGRISPERMAEAVRQAQNDDPVRGLNHFLQLLECLTPDNAPAALAVLKCSDGPHVPSWVNMLCSAWGAQNGVTAIAALTGREERGSAMAGWAHRDPAAAQQWLQSQSLYENDRRNLKQNLVTGMARQDMTAALDYIAAQWEEDRGDLARVLARGQLLHGTPAAAQWAGQLPDPSMRGAALEAVARHYMEVDPGAGDAWGAEISLAPDTRQAVARVADRMAETDVRAAFAWTLQLPASPGQEEAFQQVFSEWARQDPGASSEELRTMAPGPERDNAIHAFSRILVNESPGDAIVWAAAISDPAMRLDTQIDVARTWNAASPAEAQTWITTHLPADAQARALGDE